MKIKFAGDLARRFGPEHTIYVKTPNQAIRALCQLLPGFRTFLTGAHEQGIFFQILTPHHDKGITYEDLEFGCGEFTLVPIITGRLFGLGKAGGFLAILVGIALVAFAMSGFGLAAATIKASTFLTGLQSATISLGFGLIFTGAASLFAPGVPTGDSDLNSARGPDEAIVTGGENTTNGKPVPLVYGSFLVKGIPTISSNIKDNTGYWMGLLSEGTIGGISDIYLNGQNANGSNSGVERIESTNGNQTSKAISIVSSAGFNIPVSQSLNAQGGKYEDEDNNDPNMVIQRSFNNPDADTLVVRLAIGPVFQSKTVTTFGKNGKQTFNYREYTEDDDSNGADNPTQIEVRVLANGTLVATQRETYERILYITNEKFTFNVEGLARPITVAVERVDRQGPREPNNVTGKNSSRNYTWTKGVVTFISCDVTYNERLIYPKSALLAIKFREGELTRIPSVSAQVSGILVPQVSTNLNISYGASRNPAYVLLDLLTNPLYGAGFREFTVDGIVISQAGIRFSDIDLASFRKAANYCIAHSIHFDAHIKGDTDALQLFRAVAATFQAQLVYAGGFVTLVVDDQIADEGDIRLFSPANTIAEDEGGPHFSYEGTSKSSRSTAAEVSFVDASNFYESGHVLVEDYGAIDRYGYNLTKIRALGCTSRQQAERMGRYTVATNTLNTETVTFKAGPEAATLLPGDVVLVLDKLKTGVESGGRIISATTTSITTDRTLTSATYSTGNWFVYHYGSSGVTQKRAISSVSGSTITISGSFDSLPSSMGLWAIVNEDAVRQKPLYRVQTLKENGDGSFQVIAILYNHQKYSYINNSGSINMAAYSVPSSAKRAQSVDRNTITLTIRG